ncbi:mycofactocin-coupled SDR family oxidoreductase [Nocardia bovistercoris]|uniref:Mycofactocin-coupled SDR family oxidoreductase n=1 Tax=Nocardia bovistercoris TaxID=2785916 RepID=A0A931N6E4_9NOCA|nr:mycofactocin-coupled SDR family oxidoreductase [Nocardia bovistercoris]MBH0780874.1 mycofactocin-coupled SDR family oxidoreductase [Nocardia bovistercoris]
MTGIVQNKVALITGAARGQGRAHALRMAGEGADIIAVDLCGELPGVAYRSPEPADLEATADAVRAAGAKVVTAIADVRDLATLRAAVDGAVAELGRLDIVVANAGICIPRAWDKVSERDFDDTIGVNVRGTWNTVVVAAPHLIEAGGGSVVLISSSAGLKAQPFMIPYTTSKFAVRGMAKGFAAEFAHHNIRVNSVHPTGVDTEMGSRAMLAQVAQASTADTRLRGMLVNMLPVPGISVDDVAETVLFLASDAARHITAHAMAVDAGVSEF